MKKTTVFTKLLACAMTAVFCAWGGVIACADGSEKDNEPQATSYTVTFDTNGGSAVASQTVEAGKTATKPIDPTKEGYLFDAWYVEGGNSFDFESAITEDIKLTAHWKDPNKEYCSVTFKESDGKESTQSVVKGEIATKPTDPKKDGYTFLGWFKDGDENPFDFTNEAIIANITLTARWEAIAGSGGSGVDPSTPGGTVSKPTEIQASGSLNAKGGGWLESAWIEWSPVSNDVNDTYNVYVRKSGGDWAKIDKELVRGYGDTAGSTTVTKFRADALGLAAGSYDMKVELASDTTKNAELSGVTVLAHDRSGFAHFGYTKGIGAYNDDGTLKTGAKVVYVTKDNAKTVTATVKTGSNKSEEFKGMQAIINAYQKGADTTPITFRIIGVVSKDDMDTLGSSEEGLQIKGKNANSEMNITVEGVGEDAVITGFGILVRNSSSVELRNFAVIYCMDDCVSIDTGDSRLWVHNLDLFYGPQGSGDHAKGDGSLDSKNATMSTYSYNHFWDSGKCNLLENGTQPYSYASGSNYLTYHHNWYDHSDSRHPRVRYDNVHVYNNYYDGNSKYGVGSTEGSSVFVENNYFRNCKFPMLTSMQGNDVYAGTKDYKPGDYGTFSKEDGGTIKAYNNYMTGNTMSYATYGATSMIIKGLTVNASSYFDTKTHFDAYEVANRADKVPNTLHPVKGTAHYYSNFDTDSSIMYTYKVDTPEEAKSNVENFAGRMNGGDILRKTDMYDLTAESEDTNHELIPGFVTFLKSYKSKLVTTNVTANSTSGSGTGSGSTSGGEGESGGTTTETPATVTYPTATLKSGTITDFKGDDVNWTLIANSTSSAFSSATQVNVFPGAYLAFHLDKPATIVFGEIGNKPGKIVSSDGTSYPVAQTTNVSVEITAAGDYYFTSSHATGDSRIKKSVTVTYKTN